MICGAGDLKDVLREEISDTPHTLSGDGRFSWEEVECLGACTNAPMVQIGKDFYEDLTPDILRDLLRAFANGEVPTPGPQNGRYAAEGLAGLTALTEFESGRDQYNGSVGRAVALGDTIKRIQGDEVTVLKKATPARKKKAAVASGAGDDLKRIGGVGPALEKLLNDAGIVHFAQIAAWTTDDVLWADNNLARFKGRASRDNWVEQAKILANGGETEFSKRVAKGGVK